MLFSRLHVGLLLAILALSGCGSSGGGGAQDLSVTASAANALAGGSNIRLSATGNAAGDFTWNLSGPGRLDATSGNVVNYLPPSASALTEDSTATVTARSASGSASVDIAITGSSSMEWDHIRIPGASISKAAYGAGKFVLVESIAIYVGDGKSWSHITQLAPGSPIIASVAYGNGRFVMVGHTQFTYGKVLTSADGSNWQDVTPPPFNSPANGWPEVNGGFIYDLNSVVYANGTFIAVGRYGTTLISSDGTTWTDITEPGAGGQDFLRATGFGGTWIGAGALVTLTAANGLLRSGRYFVPTNTHGLGVAGRPLGVSFYSSPDGGRHWTYVPYATQSPCYVTGAMTSDGMRMVAAGYCGGSSLVASADGINWTPPQSSGSKTQSQFSCVQTTTGNPNTAVSSVAYGGGRFLAIACGIILSSVNGTDWGYAGGAIQNAPSSMTLSDITYTGERFVAVGGPDILISK